MNTSRISHTHNDLRDSNQHQSTVNTGRISHTHNDLRDSNQHQSTVNTGRISHTHNDLRDSNQHQSTVNASRISHTHNDLRDSNQHQSTVNASRISHTHNDLRDSTHHQLASYPGHVFGGKSGLVSTACACANDSGNFPRTGPNTDKLHMVVNVMRRNNKTRYTACSVAAVFTRRLLFTICRLYLTETSLLPRPRTQLSNPQQPTTSCQL